MVTIRIHLHRLLTTLRLPVDGQQGRQGQAEGGKPKGKPKGSGRFLLVFSWKIEIAGKLRTQTGAPIAWIAPRRGQVEYCNKINLPLHEGRFAKYASSVLMSAGIS